MNMGDAMAWIATNPRPWPQDGESNAEYQARLEEWEFRYCLMCEAIRDEKHDNR